MPLDQRRCKFQYAGRVRSRPGCSVEEESTPEACVPCVSPFPHAERGWGEVGDCCNPTPDPSPQAGRGNRVSVFASLAARKLDPPGRVIDPTRFLDPAVFQSPFDQFITE